MREKSTRQPEKKKTKKKTTKMDQQLTLPAGSCHGPEEKTRVQTDQRRENSPSQQSGGGGPGARPWKRMDHVF